MTRDKAESDDPALGNRSGESSARDGERPDPVMDGADSVGKRVGWFLVLWIAGVVTVTIVGYGIRLFLIG